MRLYQTTMAMPTGESSWWSSSQPDADETLALFVGDAMTLTARHKCPATVESVVWSGVENIGLADLMNGLWARWCWMQVDVENGIVVAYREQSERDPERMEPAVLHPSGPTPEYAERYAWLMANPALYLLCLRAANIFLWRKALQRAGVKLPNDITRWLYHTVQRTNGRRRRDEEATTI